MVVLALCHACRASNPSCYEGDYVACDCAGASSPGFAKCGADERFSACVCNGTVPGYDGSFYEDAASDAGSATGKVPFLGACQKNEDCETGLCFSFNAKGPHCSIACSAVPVCPAPSPGCSGMGVCKIQ